MYAITGITGQVGGAVAHSLLKAGDKVRAVVRSQDKGKYWAELGCEVAIATMTDANALTDAFRHVDGVFLMMPPNYDPEPGFPQIEEALTAACQAIGTCRPGKIVFLSTVGAHVQEPTLLSNATIVEERLRTLSTPVAFLRPAWFMENALWDVPAAQTAVVPSFLQPLDHPIPMVATADIGRIAAELLKENWDGTRIVELEGLRRYSANDIAAGFAKILGHAVRMEPVERSTWEQLFLSQGMRNPTPRMRMLDGFNEGWIDFEGGNAESYRGEIDLETALEECVKRATKSTEATSIK
jgi:NAD(P)H dehydrogenase (quinone)